MKAMFTIEHRLFFMDYHKRSAMIFTNHSTYHVREIKNTFLTNL